MKIAIFGDSFADVDAAVDFAWNINDTLKRSWYNILSKEYRIDNFAKSGSGLFYSYDQFCKVHSDYDKIIFLITAHGRIYANSIKEHLSGFDHILRCYENSQGEKQKVYASALNYLIYIQNDEESMTFHRLMIEDIKRKRNDALLISCFNQDRSLIDTSCSLHDISLLDIKHYDLKNDWPSLDKRACHMNDENNKIFAKLLEDWVLTNNFSMDVSQFTTSDKPVDYYFNK